MQKVCRRFGSKVVLLGSLALGASASWGCSSKSDTPASTATVTAPENVTVHVSAAQGGTVADKAGKVTLTIPAAALGQDTDITLAVTPASGGSAGDVYDFGPDGLQFVSPASLAVKADPATVPMGKSLAIGLFDGNAFQPVAGSTYAAGVVSGPIAHFTKYSIVLIDGNAVLVPPANCQAAIASFMACGGDPTGTWTFADFCVDAKTLGQDPFSGACPQFTSTVDLTSDREVTFGAGMQSNTAGTETVVFTYDFPVTCAQTKDPAATCTGLTDGKGTVCSEVTPGNCECIETDKKMKAAETAPYTIMGDVLSNGDPYQFCVNGNLLSAREITDSGTPITYVLKKK